MTACQRLLPFRVGVRVVGSGDVNRFVLYGTDYADMRRRFAAWTIGPKREIVEEDACNPFGMPRPTL